MTVNNSIVSGTIAIEDGTKAKEEFAPARKVKVELSFSVPEGGDGAAFMNGVARIAEAKVASLLGRTAAPETAAPAAPKDVLDEIIPTTVKPETAAAKKKREAAEAAAIEAAKPQKTKADLAREQGLPTADTTHKAEADELEDEPAAAPAADDDGLGDLLGDTAPAPVTDAELGKAAQEKNGDMKGKPGWAPEKIRELVGKFVLVDGKPKAGAKLQEIPAAQRHDFLEKLKALK